MVGYFWSLILTFGLYFFLIYALFDGLRVFIRFFNKRT
jgi:hypothetical protein